jgi:putative hydrolase of the HAD superfamily
MKEQSHVTNFVFDFGAVIFEWNPIVRVEEHFGGEWYGTGSAHALAQSIFGHPSWLEFDTGIASMDSVIDEAALRLGISKARLKALIHPIGEDLKPLEQSVNILKELRERQGAGEPIRIFYLSNMPEPYARALERKHEFLQWFDAGIFSADVRLAKPDLRIYQLLAKKNNLDPSSTLFIDDQLKNVQAAEQLGWQSFHLTEPGLLRQKLAPYMEFTQ